jgi:hypothetical protein
MPSRNRGESKKKGFSSASSDNEEEKELFVVVVFVPEIPLGVVSSSP